MRYVGGKARIAKRIASVINAAPSSRYYEPFVGSGAVLQIVAPKVSLAYAGDMHEDLIMMWNALLFDGWDPPSVVTEDQYQELKTSIPSPLRAFAGFGCSFGGKWFGGYARSGSRNYALNMRNGLVKFRDSVAGSNLGRFELMDYREWDPPKGSVVYFDPPYKGKQGYRTGDFDHDAMWDHAEGLCRKGCKVFVSEYQSPAQWECVMEEKKIVSLAGGSGHFTATERLFTIR